MTARVEIGGFVVAQLSVTGDQFSGKVPLEMGENKLDIILTGSNGSSSSRSYTVVRSTGFQAAITSPELETFATTESEVIRGYVTALNAGTAAQAIPVSVKINGQPTTLTAPDAVGTVQFATTTARPTAAEGEILQAEIKFSNFTVLDVSLGEREGYEIISKKETYDLWSVGAVRGDGGFFVDANYFLERHSFAPPDQKDLAKPNDLFHTERWGVDPPFSLGPEIEDQQFQLLEQDDANFRDAQPHRVDNLTGLGARRLSVSKYQLDTKQDSDGNQQFHQLLQVDGSMTFRAPRKYGPQKLVVFTFNGLGHQGELDENHNIVVDLSKVIYDGHEPISWDDAQHTVSYLLTLDGGAPYTIDKGKFSWPGAIITVLPNYYSYNRAIGFENFHNDPVTVELKLNTTNPPPTPPYKLTAGDDLDFDGSTYGIPSKLLGEVRPDHPAGCRGYFFKVEFVGKVTKPEVGSEKITGLHIVNDVVSYGERTSTLAGAFPPECEIFSEVNKEQSTPKNGFIFAIDGPGFRPNFDTKSTLQIINLTTYVVEGGVVSGTGITGGTPVSKKIKWGVRVTIEPPAKPKLETMANDHFVLTDKQQAICNAAKGGGVQK